MADAALAGAADVEAVLVRALTPAEFSFAPRLLQLASATVRKHCRQTLSLVTDDEVTFDAPTQDIELPQAPVVEVSEVTAGGVVIDPSTYDVAPGGRLRWVNSSGAVNGPFDDEWLWGLSRRRVTITYTHGYGTIPDDIVGVVAALVAGHLTGAKTNPGGLKSRTIGPFSETYGDGSRPAMLLTEDHVRTLKSYRRTVRSARIHSGTGS